MPRAPPANASRQTSDDTHSTLVGGDATARDVADVKQQDRKPEAVRILRGRILAMGLIVSLGGLIFGYDTGQISGFVQMDDFKARFAGPDGTFSNSREGLIVGLVRSS